MGSEWDMDVSYEFSSSNPFDIGFTAIDNESYDGSDVGDGNNTTAPSSEREINAGMIIIYVFLSVMTIVTVFGNCLVIMAVATTRRLRSVTNCFIVSLSVSDLLVGGLVMPLSLVYEMLGYWPFGRVMCELWSSLDVMLCTASILNLCCISLDRYFAITRPLTYTVKRNKRMALGMIMVVWIASAAITCPPLLGWYNRDFEDGLQCRYVSDTSYVIYSACGSFYIPLIVMLFVYTRIFIVIYRRNKVVKHQKHYQKSCANGCASSDDVSQSNPSKPAVKLHPMKFSEDFSLRDFRLSNSDCLISMEMVSDSLLAIRPRRESENVKDMENPSSTSNKTKGSLYRSRSYQFQFPTNNNHKIVTTTFSTPSQSKANSDRKSPLNNKNIEPNLNLLAVPQWSHGSHGTKVVASATPKQLRTSPMSNSGSSANNLSSTSNKSACESYAFTTATSTTTTSMTVDGNDSSGANGGIGPSHPAKAKLSLPALGIAEGETTTLLRATRPSKDFRRKHVRGLRMSFRKETKATTTIAVVVGGFIVCWMPFFIFYLAAPFCDCFISPMLFLGLTWLGWANSAVNPFIYAFYNMDFRAAFWKLTFGWCRKESNKSKTVVVYPQVWRSRLKGARANGIPSIVMVQSDVM